MPGSPLRHFLYKSRGNVQFTMPSFAPYFASTLAKRRLLSLYAALHATIHAKPATLKVLHQRTTECVALAWCTPLFEMYAVADAGTGQGALARGAEGVVKWVRSEEERVFIIGGAVF